MKRASGLLLHITSLPSPYGVGTLGKAAFDFVDYLHRARQRYWQILPLTPTGYGDSPYQSASTFAGNPYLVDLDLLKEQGLLTDEDIGADWGGDPRKVDFGLLYNRRRAVLEKAFARFDRSKMADYVADHAWYLKDWTLFCALKDRFEGKCWADWPQDIRDREPEAMARYAAELADLMDYHAFVQYCFDSQWQALREYAHEKGVSFIGDIPIYVPYDSADVWSHRDLFQLNEAGIPKLIAGVPPDYFSETGQLWGNPIYDWDAHEKENYAWWRSRLKGAASRCDVLRIDHFRGLESYWGVEYGAPNAIKGKWYPGPGMKLIRAFREEGLGENIIAEDLGFLTSEVKKLLPGAAPQLCKELRGVPGHPRQRHHDGLLHDLPTQVCRLRRGLPGPQPARGFPLWIHPGAHDLRGGPGRHPAPGRAGPRFQPSHEPAGHHGLVGLAGHCDRLRPGDGGSPGVLHPHDRPGARAEEEVRHIQISASELSEELFVGHRFNSFVRQEGGGPSSA